MLRKVLVLAVLTWGVHFAASPEASAFCHRQACHTTCYTPCATSCCVDECVVYRFDYCCGQWVVDSVYPAYYGNLAWAEWQANWRVQQLACCGISAYTQCFEARYTVYWYNWATCSWVVYEKDVTCERAAFLVRWLQSHGFCAAETCREVPLLKKEGQTEAKPAPAAAPPPAPAKEAAPAPAPPPAPAP